MHFDTDGIYTLQYTAEDSCGNETIEERGVEVYSLNTVLYTDGTLIINEKSVDRDANIALHGAVTNEYVPLDRQHPYIFSSSSDRPWNSQSSSIISAKTGSRIKPESTNAWFFGLTNLTSVDLSDVDTSILGNSASMFRQCTSLETVDLSTWGENKVYSCSMMFMECSQLKTVLMPNFKMLSSGGSVSASYMFGSCPLLETVDLSSFSVPSTADIANMFLNDTALKSVNLPMLYGVNSLRSTFSGCSALESVNISNFDTHTCNDMTECFKSCSSLKIIDISTFETTASTVCTNMFNGCSAIETIYASSSFVSPTTGSGMFRNMSNKLIGGAGTVWSSNNINGTYARIDNPPDAPGYFTAKA